jgi:hypothetical protein
MPKGEIVGRFTVGSELVIDGKNNDGKNKMARLGRHRKSRQEERTDGGQISGVRSERGV